LAISPCARNNLTPAVPLRHLLTFSATVLGGVVEASADIAIAKAVERKLAPVDDGQKLGVGFPQGG
jgi:hypothetical protein